MLFFYFCMTFLWLIVAAVLFLDVWLDLELIPLLWRENRSWACLIAVALLIYNFLRWFTLRARLRTHARKLEQTRRRSTPPKVVDPTFRFTEEPADPEQDKGSDI